MKIKYPDDYFGKKLRIHDVDGNIYTGELYGYNFDYDDAGNQFAEIDLETASHIIGFTEMEIAHIEVLDDEKKNDA
ncbi:hypothetical protein H7U37_00020 [Pseudoflavonifractor phocaeensis]|uniref:hypothetical protein n=1 Tax=Pseudoflavonifractor phocaeensis TaxID=1870988 RepID=UPI00195BE0DB|nr:hypothetical protein [Pseudoflavonifractor phocaeensis]MBM6936917.1 hypothetical protein [Pseudoflavonifractor phocaeensis]